MEPKLQKFIDHNRGRLDASIRIALNDPNFDIDDDERELWIANDEGLYHWARSEGAFEDEDEDEDDGENEKDDSVSFWESESNQ